MRYMILLIALCVFLSGCKTITPADLSAECQKRLAAKDVEIVKLRTSKPTPLWPIYLISGIALVAGGAIGYFLHEIVGGILLAAGGAMSIGWMQFIERFKWAFWIPFGIAIVIGLYFAWDWYQGIKAKRVVKATKPALAKMGNGTQKTKLTSLIAQEAGDAADKVTKTLGL